MVNRFRYPALVLLSLFMIGMSWSTSFGASYLIKFAGYFGPTHPASMAMQAFKERLESASDGAIEVLLYPDNQLGGEEQIMEHVKRGTAQMGIVGGLLKRDEPTFAAMELPFLIQNWQQAKRVYFSKGTALLVGNYTKKTNVHIKGFFVNGFRQISSSFPVTTMADIAKMKIRIPINDVFVRTFKALGASPVIITMSELTPALKTGVVDGQDNPFSTLRANNWFKIQPYVLETRHMFSASAILVNGTFYNRLPPAMQRIFDQCVQEAIELNWKLSEQDDADSRAFLIANGVQITAASPELKQTMHDALLPVYEWLHTTIPSSKEFAEFCQNVSQE